MVRCGKGVVWYGEVWYVPVTVMLPVENTCTVALRVFILYEAAG